MSRYEWESGTLVLPSAAVAQVKGALREHCTKFHQDVRAEVDRQHREVGKGTRSAKVYRQRLNAARAARWAYSAAHPTSGFNRGPSAGEAYAQTVRDAAGQVLEQMVTDAEGRYRAEPLPVHKPTVSEVSREAPTATNRTTVFRVDGEASVAFDGRRVSWSVSENNHAVDTARNSPLGMVFFTALDKVKWTRGTGGTLVGNDEYNGESEAEGGGANYVTARYGPLGEPPRYRVSKGGRVSVSYR